MRNAARTGASMIGWLKHAVAALVPERRRISPELIEAAASSALAWTIRRDTPGDGTQEHHPGAIRLAFSGDHGWGAAGRWDARLIDAVMKETIERHAPQALILDLRELDYRWGDDIARIMEPRNIPVAIVVSPRCAAGLESLADALGLEAFNVLFASPEAARRHLRDTRQTGARGTTPRTA